MTSTAVIFLKSFYKHNTLRNQRLCSSQYIDTHVHMCTCAHVHVYIHKSLTWSPRTLGRVPVERLPVNNQTDSYLYDQLSSSTILSPFSVCSCFDVLDESDINSGIINMISIDVCWRHINLFMWHRFSENFRNRKRRQVRFSVSLSYSLSEWKLKTWTGWGQEWKEIHKILGKSIYVLNTCDPF